MATAERTEVQVGARFSGRFLGFFIVVIVPTMFWTSLIGGIAWACGRPLSFAVASIISVVLFAFISCIWASFAMTDHQSASGE